MKSPYLCNPNILAHPDRLVQSVALDMTAQDCYLAGSPISAEGKLANDATAIGILLYDVHKQIGGTTGVVVISGRIQQDVAAEHSGVTISADCKAALIDVTFTGDGCRMGGGGSGGGVSVRSKATATSAHVICAEDFETEMTDAEKVSLVERCFNAVKTGVSVTLYTAASTGDTADAYIIAPAVMALSQGGAITIAFNSSYAQTNLSLIDGTVTLTDIG